MTNSTTCWANSPPVSLAAWQDAEDHYDSGLGVATEPHPPITDPQTPFVDSALQLRHVPVALSGIEIEGIKDALAH